MTGQLFHKALLHENKEVIFSWWRKPEYSVKTTNHKSPPTCSHDSGLDSEVRGSKPSVPKDK